MMLKKPLFKARKKGGIAIIILVMGAVFLIVNMIALTLFREGIMSGVDKVKDGSDFSNLATYKYIDRWKLGSTNELTFNEADLNKVLLTFKDYLGRNLNLDSNLSPIGENHLLNKPLVINKMIVYSLENNRITEYTYTKNNSIFKKKIYNPGDTVKTPQGRIVEKTSVYTEIEFGIDLMYGEEYTNVIPSYTDIIN